MTPTPTATMRPSPISLPASISQSAAFAGLLRHEHREEQRDERGGDAIVQAALHVECAPDPDRHGGVREDREPERGVGRGKDRTDERRRRPPRGREQECADHGPERDREREADQEEPAGKASVVFHLTEPDGGGIGEQQERERQLHDQEDRLARQRDIDLIGDALAQQHARETKTIGAVIESRSSRDASSA